MRRTERAEAEGLFIVSAADSSHASRESISSQIEQLTETVWGSEPARPAPGGTRGHGHATAKVAARQGRRRRPRRTS